MRLISVTVALLLAFGAPAHGQGAVKADRVSVFATQAEGKSVDEDRSGGNPFATALLELMESPKLTVTELLQSIGPLTTSKSYGIQVPEVVGAAARGHTLTGQDQTLRRVALVIGYSDYSRTEAPSLPGVAHDVSRIRSALFSKGFDVWWLLDPSPMEAEAGMRRFAQTSSAAQIAVVYATGHGVEFDGRAYLLPGNHARAASRNQVAKSSLPLTRLSSVLRATELNLFLYGACRNDPFADDHRQPSATKPAPKQRP